MRGMIGAALPGLSLVVVASVCTGATLQFEHDLTQVETGASVLARVTLDTVATTDTCVTVMSSHPALLTLPAPLTIPAGRQAIDFRVQVARTTQPTTTAVSVRASVAPCVAPAVLGRDLAVLATPVVTAIAAAPSAVQGGSSVQLALKLDRPAAYPGVSVAVASTGSGLVSHPKALTVPMGTNESQTTLTTQPVVVPMVIQVSAGTAGTATATTSLVLHSDPGSGEPAALAGITAAHNSVRASVGVQPLRWNTALAATAQQWATACVDQKPQNGMIDHNAGRSSGYPYYIGENLFAMSGPAAVSSQAVNAWASEASVYDYASNTCAGVCGHYTQLVWRNTLEVGCAVATCSKLPLRSVLVCNYAPGGNVNGERPY